MEFQVLMVVQETVGDKEVKYIYRNQDSDKRGQTSAVSASDLGWPAPGLGKRWATLARRGLRSRRRAVA